MLNKRSSPGCCCFFNSHYYQAWQCNNIVRRSHKLILPSWVGIIWYASCYRNVFKLFYDTVLLNFMYWSDFLISADDIIFDIITTHWSELVIFADDIKTNTVALLFGDVTISHWNTGNKMFLLQKSTVDAVNLHCSQNPNQCSLNFCWGRRNKTFLLQKSTVDAVNLHCSQNPNQCSLNFWNDLRYSGERRYPK